MKARLVRDYHIFKAEVTFSCSAPNQRNGAPAGYRDRSGQRHARGYKHAV